MSRLLYSARAAAMLLLGVAAVSKLWDLPRFEQSLRSWPVLPEESLGFVAIFVPVMELALACLFFASSGHARRAALTAAALLAVFSGVYGILLAFGHEPDCLCFGKILAFRHARSEAFWLLARNAAMISALLGPECVRRVGTRKQRPSTPAEDWTSERATARGFTIVEILVCIVIVSTLLSLTLPLLSSARSRARQAASAVSARSCAMLLNTYANDNRDSMIVYSKPGEWRSWPEADQSRLKCGYFYIAIVWAHVLKQQGYIPEIGDAFISPDAPAADPLTGQPLRYPGAVHYQPSCSFLATDGFWRPSTRIGPAQWRSRALCEARIASRKVLVASIFPWSVAARMGTERSNLTADLAFVDGTAGRYQFSNSTMTGVLGDGLDWAEKGALHATEDPPGTHTPLDDVDVR
ncbi:MAG: prepilin-type N-terminal cleavage/methylation domain-containing protein [Phycisphaerales bacterium]|jgi:prepilin-type N-terminal cleavage/methylation domain-containing protein|nr:prepilin-type N-terminal cleavage/methylation domain-containing protein [Phycisphaerales bacterium]